MTAGLDSGPVCAQAKEPIGAQDTYGTLAPRLAELGGELLVARSATAGDCVEQDEEVATYAEKIEPADRLLDPAGRRPSSSGSCAR